MRMSFNGFVQCTLASIDVQLSNFNESIEYIKEEDEDEERNKIGATVGNSQYFIEHFY